MIVRLLFFLCLAAIVLFAHAWHAFARWFVDSQGILPGILLLIILLLLSQLPYWEA
jgi:hypothetical protein